MAWQVRTNYVSDWMKMWRKFFEPNHVAWQVRTNYFSNWMKMWREFFESNHVAWQVRTSYFLVCERRRIFGCRLSPPKITRDSRKYVCVRRLVTFLIG